MSGSNATSASSTGESVERVVWQGKVLELSDKRSKCYRRLITGNGDAVAFEDLPYNFPAMHGSPAPYCSPPAQSGPEGCRYSRHHLNEDPLSYTRCCFQSCRHTARNNYSPRLLLTQPEAFNMCSSHYPISLGSKSASTHENLVKVLAPDGRLIFLGKPTASQRQTYPESGHWHVPCH